MTPIVGMVVIFTHRNLGYHRRLMWSVHGQIMFRSICTLESLSFQCSYSQMQILQALDQRRQPDFSPLHCDAYSRKESKKIFHRCAWNMELNNIVHFYIPIQFDMYHSVLCSWEKQGMVVNDDCSSWYTVEPLDKNNIRTLDTVLYRCP